MGSAARDSMNRKTGVRTGGDEQVAPDREVGPVGGGLVGQAHEEEDDADGEDEAAQIVEVAGRWLTVDRGQVAVDDVEGDRADGQVDEEDPVPAEVVRQPAAQQRADDRGDPEDGAEEALIAASLTGREEVADDGQRDREDGACADALDAPEEDEALHRPREGRQERAQQEDADAEEQHQPAPVDVRELAVEDARDGRRQQVAGDGPGVELVGATQLAHDARQGHAHDGLVQG